MAVFAIACGGDPLGNAEPSEPRDDDGQVELGANSQRHRNYDARIDYNRKIDVIATARMQDLAGAFPGADVGATFDRATGVTRTLVSRTGFLSAPQSGQLDSIARAFVIGRSAALGLSFEDVGSMETTNVVASAVGGTSHHYLRQKHAELSVYNGQMQINMLRDGRVLGVNNSFMPNLAAHAPSIEPKTDAAFAVESAAHNLSIDLTDTPAIMSVATDASRQSEVIATELSTTPMKPKLMWLAINAEEVALVWNFQIETLDSNHFFDYTVDANTGKVWTRFDWTNSDSYHVYDLPVESANHSSPPQPADGRVVVTDPQDTELASPLGWHDTGSAQFTVHRGNNVHAYNDRDGNNAPPGSEPSCGASLDCDFPLDLSQDPSSYTGAAVSNLFFWNNVIHDVQYRYGFDEAAGNFQVSNFANGGAGGDDVRAEAQDGGGTNNANFSTPTDGGRPRMQMFEWTLTNPRRDGDFDNGIIVHEYGHGISIRQVGGPNNSSCLNNNQQGGEGWSDFLALAYTAKAGDQGTDPRGIGTYALGQPTSGDGIRTQRYSTDPSVNNHTYESIQGMAIPHGVGEVWATVLWEAYWALVEQHGFDPDIYNSTAGAGNHRAMLYVNEGLKNTACSPTFVDARDGIIQAAQANFNAEDVCVLWETFAAFGLGTDAISGGSNSTNPTNGFSVPASCDCSPQPTADAGPDQTVCAGESVTLGTPAQANNTYSWDPGGETTAQITVTPAQTTSYTVTASTTCGSASDSVTVVVDEGNGADFNEDFESGAAGWTATGQWHLASDSTCTAPEPGYSSATNAFYYGQDASCDYDLGAANNGTLTSPLIAGISATSVLSFDYYRQVESFNGNFDLTFVEVIDGSGNATNVFALNSSNPSEATWKSSGDISLSAFAGQTIQVRFTFDSVDNVSNDLDGWLIDDVVVTTDSSCSPTNLPPMVSVDSPADGSVFAEGSTVTFAGSGDDPEDGDIGGTIEWTSSIDGALGTGSSVSAALSVGSHQVTATVTDTGGLSASMSIGVTVNAAPSVSIDSPADGSTFDEGDLVTFAGSASDAEDGDLGPSIAWSSDRDGSLGTGDSVAVMLSGGVHTITAAVTDSGGLSASDSISVTVNASGGTGFFDDFESGAAGWTTTGLWHLADDSSCASPGYSSATNAFYYGQDASCNYNTGGSNTGDLVSPAITGVAADSVLSFDFFRQVESFATGSFDRVEVQVLTDGGSTSTTVFSRDSGDASTSAWISSGDISLAAFAGQSIQIRFRFSTIDSVANNFIGWFIDDVRVE